MTPAKKVGWVFVALAPALGIVLGLVIGGLEPTPQVRALVPALSSVEIRYRSFSTSESIDPPMTVFASRLAVLTDALDVGQIRLTRLPGVPPIPATFHGDIVAEVSAGSSAGGLDAAYISGTELSASWGFLVNSGYPMGPSFGRFLGFLWGRSVDNGQQTGAELVQSILDKRSRGVVALPVAASPGQLSGYFPAPIGTVPGHVGIGLAGLCQQPWRIRYLPPAQDVLERACSAMGPSTLSFVQAIPGGGSLITALRSGKISGFEFATPLDDVSQLFPEDDDPGLAGAPFVHTPGWHQPFLVTWLIVNRKVWDRVGTQRQYLMRTVADANVTRSYGESLRQQGKALRLIVNTPRMIMSRWPNADLENLRVATKEFLEIRRTDVSFSASDRADFVRILDALLSYLREEEPFEAVQSLP